MSSKFAGSSADAQNMERARILPSSISRHISYLGLWITNQQSHSRYVSVGKSGRRLRMLGLGSTDSRRRQKVGLRRGWSRGDDLHGSRRH